MTKRKPSEIDGVLYYSNTYLNVDTAQMNTVVTLVDDKNINEPTLSRRRLRMKAQSAPLYPLRKAIFFLSDFIKMAKPGYWFIDNYGNTFQYTKATRAPLRFRKIKRIIPTRSTGSLLEIEGYPQRFKTLFVVNERMRYAAVIEYRGMALLYGVYDKQYRDSWRMI